MELLVHPKDKKTRKNNRVVWYLELRAMQQKYTGTQPERWEEAKRTHNYKRPRKIGYSETLKKHSQVTRLKWTIEGKLLEKEKNTQK